MGEKGRSGVGGQGRLWVNPVVGVHTSWTAPTGCLFRGVGMRPRSLAHTYEIAAADS